MVNVIMSGLPNHGGNLLDPRECTDIVCGLGLHYVELNSSDLSVHETAMAVVECMRDAYEVGFSGEARDIWQK